MQRISFIALIIIVSANIIGAQQFEGLLKYKITGDGKENIIYYKVKGDAIRMEVESDQEKSAIIYDNQKMLILMDEQKMYMEVTLDMENESDPDENEQSENVKFNRTNKTKEILGFLCTLYELEDDQQKINIWATEELGNFAGFNNPMDQEEQPWQKYVGDSFFPLVIEIIENDDEIIQRIEVIEVNKIKIDDSVFSPPADYQRINTGILTE